MIIPNKQIANFLGKKVIDNKFIFIDLWSFVHLLSGFILMKYFLYGKSPPFSDVLGSYNPLVYLFALLVLYELFEFAVIKSGSKFFRPESKRDVIWDLIIGLIGGFIYLNWFI